MVRNAGCSSKGPTWVSFPASTWWLATTCDSSPRGLDTSFGLLGHQARKWCTDILAGKTSICILRPLMGQKISKNNFGSKRLHLAFSLGLHCIYKATQPLAQSLLTTVNISCQEINIETRCGREYRHRVVCTQPKFIRLCYVSLTGTAKQNSLADAGNKNRKYSKHPAT